MPDPDPWRCSWCLKHYAVPSLARACENRHLEENQ